MEPEKFGVEGHESRMVFNHYFEGMDQTRAEHDLDGCDGERRRSSIDPIRTDLF